MPHSPTKTRTPHDLKPVLVIVGLCIAASGCGEKQFPVAPAEGKIICQGKPLECGSVIFQPRTGPPARGKIQSDGTFVLSTYGNGDGAMIGTHRVRIACFENQRPGAIPDNPQAEPTLGRPLVPRRYTNIQTSGLQVEVKSSNEPFVLDLE